MPTEPRDKMQLNVGIEPDSMELLRSLVDRLNSTPTIMQGPGDYRWKSYPRWTRGDIVSMALAALAKEIDAATPDTEGNAYRERVLRAVAGEVEPRRSSPNPQP